MKTRTYLILFLAASLLVIAGALLKIEKKDTANLVLGISLLAQGVVLIAFLYQRLVRKE